jgi:hypothetical protein
VGGSFPERVVIGKWFDGSKRQATEEALWLSPYSVARLGWDWERSRAQFDGALSFAVRLTALERQDPLEFGGDTAPGDDVSRAVFTLEAVDPKGKAKPLPVEISLRWTQRGRDPKQLLRIPWLGFVYGDPPERLPLGVGRNQIAVYELRSPLRPESVGAFSFRLRITTPRRTREAVFKRWPRIESGG